MLVLSRKQGESVVIGQDGSVTITVLSIKGDKVRLGFAAPREVIIDREERRTPRLVEEQPTNG